MSQRRQRHFDEDQAEEEEYETYGTPIRPRQRFTAEETRILEDLFKSTIRPTAEAKQSLARQFGTSTQRIQIWFQNRRAKEKKNSSDSDGIKPEGESSNPRLDQRKRKREDEQEDHTKVPRVPLLRSHLYRTGEGDHFSMTPFPYHMNPPTTINPLDMQPGFDNPFSAEFGDDYTSTLDLSAETSTQDSPEDLRVKGEF